MLPDPFAPRPPALPAAAAAEPPRPVPLQPFELAREQRIAQNAAEAARLGITPMVPVAAPAARRKPTAPGGGARKRSPGEGRVAQPASRFTRARAGVPIAPAAALETQAMDAGEEA